jgi:hypothetical protein
MRAPDSRNYQSSKKRNHPSRIRVVRIKSLSIIETRIAECGQTQERNVRRASQAISMVFGSKMGPPSASTAMMTVGLGGDAP